MEQQGGLHKVKNIITGWKRYMSGRDINADIMAMAEHRASICVSCPHFKSSTAYTIIDKIASAIGNTAKLEKTDVTGRTCDLCHCQFPAKLMVPNEHCPDNPPRWTAIES
jgi:hypothetical protein